MYIYNEGKADEADVADVADDDDSCSAAGEEAVGGGGRGVSRSEGGGFLEACLRRGAVSVAAQVFSCCSLALRVPRMPLAMLTYAHVCSRMLTYAHVCSRMLTYADVC